MIVIHSSNFIVKIFIRKGSILYFTFPCKVVNIVFLWNLKMHIQSVQNFDVFFNFGLMNNHMWFLYRMIFLHSKSYFSIYIIQFFKILWQGLESMHSFFFRFKQFGHFFHVRKLFSLY